MGKAERTREFILDKTSPVFNRKGFAGTSLSDLTDTTSLTKGAIYGNFVNKDEVALAAFDHNMAKILNQVKIQQSSETTIIGKLKVYIKVYRNGLTHNGVLNDGCPIINTGIEADDTHPQLRQKVIDMLSKWNRGISSLILQGIKQGEINEGVNIAGFAALMITILEGGITLSKISGENKYIDQSMDHLEHLIDANFKK